MTIYGYKIGARLIGFVLMALAVVAFLFWGPAMCRSNKTAKKQAEVSAGQAGASINSGAEATNTLGNVMSNDAATDSLVGMGQTEIAAASQGSKGKAARKAACRLKAYRDTPQCQEPVK